MQTRACNRFFYPTANTKTCLNQIYGEYRIYRIPKSAIQVFFGDGEQKKLPKKEQKPTTYSKRCLSTSAIEKRRLSFFVFASGKKKGAQQKKTPTRTAKTVARQELPVALRATVFAVRVGVFVVARLFFCRRRKQKMTVFFSISPKLKDTFCYMS